MTNKGLCGVLLLLFGFFNLDLFVLLLSGGKESNIEKRRISLLVDPHPSHPRFPLDPVLELPSACQGELTDPGCPVF